jgi:hypothetical protein
MTANPTPAPPTTIPVPPPLPPPDVELLAGSVIAVLFPKSVVVEIFIVCRLPGENPDLTIELSRVSYPHITTPSISIDVKFKPGFHVHWILVWVILVAVMLMVADTGMQRRTSPKMIR